jgi:hypothetical protein
MAGTSRKNRVYEVVVSFDALNRGERFSQPADNWSTMHTEHGYLRDVTDEPPASHAESGDAPPEAAPERVQEAKHAGETGKG